MQQALELLLFRVPWAPAAAAPRVHENGPTMTGQRIRFVFHALIFVSMFVTAAAQATDLPVQGGPGGSNFRRECSSISSLEFMSVQAIGSTPSG